MHRDDARSITAAFRDEMGALMRPEVMTAHRWQGTVSSTNIAAVEEPLFALDVSLNVNKP